MVVVVVLMLRMLSRFALSQMPMEDDERICAERGRDLLYAKPAPPCPCDREPGAVRLAAVEPDEADG